MFDILTADAILQEERARLAKNVRQRILVDIAHGLAPELAVASHVTDEATRTRLQRRISDLAYRRKPGSKERLMAYPHDPFK
jgi:hypothetical protein